MGGVDGEEVRGGEVAEDLETVVAAAADQDLDLEDPLVAGEAEEVDVAVEDLVEVAAAGVVGAHEELGARVAPVEEEHAHAEDGLVGLGADDEILAAGELGAEVLIAGEGAAGEAPECARTNFL